MLPVEPRRNREVGGGAGVQRSAEGLPEPSGAVDERKVWLYGMGHE